MRALCCVLTSTGNSDGDLSRLQLRWSLRKGFGQKSKTPSTSPKRAKWAESHSVNTQLDPGMIY